jgi:hypothetical protein
MRAERVARRSAALPSLIDQAAACCRLDYLEDFGSVAAQLRTGTRQFAFAGEVGYNAL